MGWEFVAISAEDHTEPLRWKWRRIADDANVVMEESGDFPDLSACVDDARRHGFVGNGGPEA